MLSSPPRADTMLIIRAAQRSIDQLVREVAQSVRDGGTIIFPTETVYGIGCAPEYDIAVDAIFAAKGRRATKPLALHVADVAQALPFVQPLTACAYAAIEKFWPGPLAIVVKRRAGRYEHAACSGETISLRCPNHDLCRQLLTGSGPLAATSANRSGEPAFTGDESQLGRLPEASLAVLAGATTLRKESTVLDCSGDVAMVLREGAVSVSDLSTRLGTAVAVQPLPQL